MFESISSKLANVFASDLFQPLALLAQQDDAGSKEIIPYIPNGILAFATLILMVMASAFIGRLIANSLRLSEYGGKLGLITWCIATAILLVSVNGFTPKFGIDLRGGINMIGALNVDSIDVDQINSNSKTKADQIIPSLYRRVDPNGLLEIQIRPLGEDKIEVTIPTDSEVEALELWSRLVKTGKLQFLIVAESQFSKHAEARELATNLAARGSLSRKVGSVTKTVDGQERQMPIAKWFSLAREDSDGRGTEPQPFKMIPSRSMLLRNSATGRLVDIASIPRLSNKEKTARLQFTKWWEDNYRGAPQVLLMEPYDESMRVTGSDLSPGKLRQGFDERGRDSVLFGLTSDGSGRMFNFTWEHKPDNNQGKYSMAIVLDDQTHTWPQLNEPIRDSGRIVGNFSRKEVDDLITSLKAGNIDVALNDTPISKSFVESDLGQELKEKGLIAIGCSFVVVLLFMIVYYRFAGLVAASALLLNLLFILALVMAIQQPLTLTGLAGLVLTVGMSVDANVLIFERIREELDKGAALRMAIRNGFDKATTTIVDANVTTLITAIVLYLIGTEQIKGFAVTLILGILMSMFTAIYCSRCAFDIWERKRWITRLGMMKMLSKSHINFIDKRFVAGVASAIVIGIGVTAVYGLQQKILHLDLRGGSTARVVFNENPATDGVDGRTVIEKALNEAGLEHKGELIEYSVSSVSSQLDNEFKDRIYKIDSNIPSYNGEEEKFDELPDIIETVFQGQLELLEVEVGATTVQGNSPSDSETGLSWPRRDQWMAAANWNRPGVILASQGQEGDSDSQQGEEEPTQDDADLSSESADANGFEEEVVGVDDSQAGSDENDFESTAAGDDDVVTAPEILRIATPLKFKFDVSGQAVKSFVISAAGEDYELTREQIKLTAPGLEAGKSAKAFMSKEWTVELEMSDPSEAESLFAGFADTYNNRPYFPTISAVGAQIAQQTQGQAAIAIIASLLGIIAYVWIRFQNVAFGLAAVVALIHDVLIVIGAIAISHYVSDYLGFLRLEDFKISLPVVAALLTIIGYSLNDTIVVFDRIREVRGKRPELNAEIINTSISQTLSRTILTSLTTFIVVFILYWFGGDAIHGFAFSLVVGVMVGTYSSIFVASPVLLWLMNSVGLNPGDPLVTEADAA